MIGKRTKEIIHPHLQSNVRHPCVQLHWAPLTWSSGWQWPWPEQTEAASAVGQDFSLHKAPVHVWPGKSINPINPINPSNQSHSITSINTKALVVVVLLGIVFKRQRKTTQKNAQTATFKLQCSDQLHHITGVHMYNPHGTPILRDQHCAINTYLENRGIPRWWSLP